jgi:RHS repeat-associated protein
MSTISSDTHPKMEALQTRLWREAIPNENSVPVTAVIPVPTFESNGAPVNGDSTSQSIPVVAEHKYIVSANISGEMLDPNASWSLSVLFYDGNGAAIGSQVDVFTQASQMVLPTIRNAQGAVTAPAGTIALKVKLAANFASGRISVSDVTVTQITSTKYYFAGAQRVAMRSGSMLRYLLADHLGSTSLVTDASGYTVSETRYKAWGEIRFASSLTPGLPTKSTYTGQYSYQDDPTTAASEGFGLMYYGARWYDSQLGRFAQADTIVPPGVQGLDRYAAMNNNPVHWT